MLCPVCSKPLMVVERNKIEFDYCPFKHGIWFDSGELELLPEIFGKHFTIPDELYSNQAAASEEKTRNCPRCDAKMEKVWIGGESSKQSQILIDRCPNKHGFWFDKGELSSFINNLKGLTDENEVQMFEFMGEVFHL